MPHKTSPGVPGKDTATDTDSFFLYLPPGDTPVPVAVVVHGGGWSGRDRTDMEDICGWLAKEGVAAYNINYRLAPGHVFPAQLEV